LVAASLVGDCRGRASSLAKRSSSRGDSVVRARSVATLVLQRAPTPLPVAVRVSVTPLVDVGVAVDVPSAQLDGQALPAVCRAGTLSIATFVSAATARGSETRGNLRMDGFEGVPFGVAHDRRGATFVGSPGRWRCTVLGAPNWDWRGNADKPTEGLAADLELTAATLAVRVRVATPVELKRCLQLQALREAEQGEDYDTLHAQIQKAKMAGVETEHIERGEERLKVLRKLGLHIAAGCDKDTLREQMHWCKVTSQKGALDTTEPCARSVDCPCNAVESPGEILDIQQDAVQGCLGEGTDRELYEELLESALSVDEGSVWKAGGKFIFSAFNRNQSVTALTRMLEAHGRQRCADMLLQLVKASESKYGGLVTAVQINFHPHGGTYHDQHRDIYSAKQRAGPNCTCSFRECVGTVCFSLGSSRICLCETMTDDMSQLRPCCERCEGRRERRWLHSGEAMFFNAAWNSNHTHGIPAMPREQVGPRISVAFLLGADAAPFKL